VPRGTPVPPFIPCWPVTYARTSAALATAGYRQAEATPQSQNVADAGGGLRQDRWEKRGIGLRGCWPTEPNTVQLLCLSKLSWPRCCAQATALGAQPGSHLINCKWVRSKRSGRPVLSEPGFTLRRYATAAPKAPPVLIVPAPDQTTIHFDLLPPVSVVRLERLLLLFRLRIDGLHRLVLTSAPMEPSLGLQFVY
jgi:hypothetical protein